MVFLVGVAARRGQHEAPQPAQHGPAGAAPRRRGPQAASPPGPREGVPPAATPPAASSTPQLLRVRAVSRAAATARLKPPRFSAPEAGGSAPVALGRRLKSLVGEALAGTPRERPPSQKLEAEAPNAAAGTSQA